MATTTATCYCGSVQLAFPIDGENLVDVFICHCLDCRKLTASTFASNFMVKDSTLQHIRGSDLLSTFSKTDTIASGNTMTNYFCSVCGTLMYRVNGAFPKMQILRVGTVDDREVLERRLKPRVEQYVRSRVPWLGELGEKGEGEGKGVKQVQGSEYHFPKPEGRGKGEGKL